MLSRKSKAKKFQIAISIIDIVDIPTSIKLDGQAFFCHLTRKQRHYESVASEVDDALASKRVLRWRYQFSFIVTIYFSNESGQLVPSTPKVYSIHIKDLMGKVVLVGEIDMSAFAGGSGIQDHGVMLIPVQVKGGRERSECTLRAHVKTKPGSRMTDSFKFSAEDFAIDEANTFTSVPWNANGERFSQMPNEKPSIGSRLFRYSRRSKNASVFGSLPENTPVTRTLRDFNREKGSSRQSMRPFTSIHRNDTLHGRPLRDMIDDSDDEVELGNDLYTSNGSIPRLSL